MGNLQVPPAARRIFGRRLRAWYRRHARELPWRQTRDAYAVLVSELMLQQTQVARVVEYYESFLARFPTLEAVAAASPAQVREAWHGLGYYARARNLHTLARTLVTQSRGPRDRGCAAGRRPWAALPADPHLLRQLPGIGPYTAGAVASFAHERRAALVDTNVARVLTRVFAPHLDPRTARGRRAAWHLAEQLLPRAGAVAYTHNQALMELGALVCTARVARCGVCPVRQGCGWAKKTGSGIRVQGSGERQQPPLAARTAVAVSRTPDPGPRAEQGPTPQRGVRPCSA